MSIRIFNADDHPMLRKGVTDLIKETDEMESVGSAADGKEALSKIRAIQPDIALLDIEMPYLTGLEVAQTLIKEGSKIRFILLTLFKDETFFHNAMQVGVMGYLLKDSKESEILDCIRSVYGGRPYENPSLTHLLFQQKKVEDKLFKNLTEHEINILKLISKQKTTAEIADMLFISPKTVSNHRNNISKKLDLAGQQNGLLKWAIEHKDFLK